MEWVAIPSLGDLPDPEVEPGSQHCRQVLDHLSHHVLAVVNSAAMNIGVHVSFGGVHAHIYFFYMRHFKLWFYQSICPGFSCTVTCGILVPHQGVNPHPLHWKADS